MKVTALSHRQVESSSWNIIMSDNNLNSFNNIVKSNPLPKITENYNAGF